jgi:hypothetical protein
MNKVSRFLLSPYPASASAWSMFKRSMLFGAFVFLFLLVFQPFGLNLIKERFILIISGYAVICVLVMLLLNIGFVRVFSGFFAENRWNSGKEIFWTLINILSIGLANAIYSSYLGMFPLNLKGVLMFETFTLLIGIIPVTISVLLRSGRLDRQFKKESQDINSSIPQSHTESPTAKIIEIKSEYAKDGFSVRSTDLLYIRSADNYIEVFFTEGEQIKQRMVRSSMKDQEKFLSTHPHFFRCHKRFLVNMDKVTHVSGNAQGLKLHLKGSSELIPVSRNYTKIIKEKLTVHP